MAKGFRRRDEQVVKYLSNKNIPTVVSRWLHVQSQAVSFAAALVGMTVTRIIANNMIMAVKEQMPMSASFCLVGIHTFQSIKMGMVMTSHKSVNHLINNRIALTHKIC